MSNQTNHRPMGHRRRGPGAPVEKAKDFKGSFKKLIAYIGNYKFAVLADCKYGYRAKGGLISLNLLRSPSAYHLPGRIL